MALCKHKVFFETRELTVFEKEKIQNYFKIKRRSGGGECGPVERVSEGIYKISFLEQEAQRRVLEREEHVIVVGAGELRLSVTRHDLPGVNKDSTDSQQGGERRGWVHEETTLVAESHQEQDVSNDAEDATIWINLPCKEAYHDLLRPHFLVEIEQEHPNLTFGFDLNSRQLQITGRRREALAVQSCVNDTVRRLKKKKISMMPLQIAYLRSRDDVVSSLFSPSGVYATIDLSSSDHVTIYGLSGYDLERAETILTNNTQSKTLYLDKDVASITSDESFQDFIKDLNDIHKSMQVTYAMLYVTGEEKHTCSLVGQKDDFEEVEEKILNYLQQRFQVTETLEVDQGLEIAKHLCDLLPFLGLNQFKQQLHWNVDKQVVELTGTQQSNEEARIAITEKIRGLKCKTVTVCEPGAYTYFNSDGREFLNSLQSLLLCQAILQPEPGELNLRQMVPFSELLQPKDKEVGVLLHMSDTEIFFFIRNAIINIEVADRVTDLSDAIVNPLCKSHTESTMLNSAGSVVKEELTRLVQRSTITLTGPGDLPCRLLIHFPCLCGPKAGEFLQLAIQECQKRKWKSITIFLDENELHANVNKNDLAELLINTAVKNLDEEEGITILLAQPGLLKYFQDEIQSVYHHLLMMSQNDLLFFSVSFTGAVGCFRSRPKQVEHHHSSQCEPAVIQLIGREEPFLNKAQEALEKHYSSFLSTETLINPMFLSLERDKEIVIRKIQDLEEKHCVKVIMKDSSVVFYGLAINTSRAKEEAFELLKEGWALTQMKNKKKFSENIQWMMCCEEEPPISLNCEDNYNVEAQHMCLKDPITVEKAGTESYRVDFKTMTATNSITQQKYNMQRTEITDHNFPGKWTKNVADAFNKEDIDIASLEYLFVERKFNETCSNKRIVKIERIENKKLWESFILHISGKVHHLFYGVNNRSAKQVETTGFFRPPESFFSSENALGKGIYFYVEASSALRRCDTDLYGNKVMFLGRVETGSYTLGTKGIYAPPPVNYLNPTRCHNSVVDNTKNPKVFVVFGTDKAYPEYRITFKDIN